jgi:hypothetical protein
MAFWEMDSRRVRHMARNAEATNVVPGRECSTSTRRQISHVVRREPLLGNFRDRRAFTNRFPLVDGNYMRCIGSAPGQGQTLPQAIRPIPLHNSHPVWARAMSASTRSSGADGGRTQRRVGSRGADSVPSERLRNCGTSPWGTTQGLVCLPYRVQYRFCSAPVLTREAPSFLPRRPSPQGDAEEYGTGFFVARCHDRIQKKSPSP